MTETTTMPNRRQRRLAMKYQGILKAKSKLSYKDWLKVCRESLEKGKEIHEANRERVEKGLVEKLEELESSKITQWKEEGYTDKEIEELREVFATMMVRDKETWHSDKKIARKKLRELRSKLYQRKS
jgi:hypothetical protein